MNVTRKLLVIVVACALLLLSAAGASAWVLLRDDDQTDRGSCEGSGSYELSVEPEDGGLEVSFELQSFGADETWTVAIEHDGIPLLEGERRTDEDGEIDLDVYAQDTAGNDEFRARATNADGQTCTTTVSRS